MSEGILGKAATMEIPISSNGDTGGLPEDDGLEQDLQQVMVSGPNLNETSIVSGGYGGSAEGILPSGTVKGRLSCQTSLTPRTIRVPQCVCRQQDGQPGRRFSRRRAAPAAPQRRRSGRGGGARHRRGEVRHRQEVGHQHVQVHQAAPVGALRPRLAHGGPGAGDADRAAAGDEAQVRVRAAAGARPHAPLLQPGADAARAGRRLRRPQPEVPRAAGGVRLQRGNAEAALQERGDAAGRRELLCVQHQHAGEQDHGGHAHDGQAVRDGQAGVRRVPHGPGGAEHGPAGRRHPVPPRRRPEPLPEPQGQVREAARRRGHQAEVPGGEQGQGDAQAAAALPQRRLRVLRREPAAAGADPQAVQHQAQEPGRREALVAGGAVRGARPPAGATDLSGGAGPG